MTARLVVAVASPVKREGSTRAKHDWVQWQEKVMASEVSRVSNNPNHQRCPQQSGWAEVKPRMQVSHFRIEVHSQAQARSTAQMRTEEKILT